MNDTKLNLCRPRDFGGLFTITIDFIKQNYKQFLITMLMYVFPFMVLAGFAMGFMYKDFNFYNLINDPSAINEVDNFGFSYFGGALGTLLFYTIAVIMMCTITFKYVQLYIEQESIVELTPKDIWNESKSNLGWILGYGLFFIFTFYILATIAVLLCVFIFEYLSAYFLIAIIPLLFIAFIYATVPLMYVLPLKVEEPELGLFQVIGKSFKLAKGSWWRSFGFILVFSMLVGVTSYVFLIPMYIFIFIMALFGGNAIAMFLSGLGTGIFYGLASLVGSFMYIAISILFYSLYEKVTGKYLKEQIESIGTGLGYDAAESL